MRRLLIALLALPAWAQITVSDVSTTQTQAILRYVAPSAAACTLQVADMNRSVSIASGSQAGGVVTITTPGPHGLLTGAVVYLENSGVAGWNGWQTVTGAPTPTSFTFAGGAGSSTGGTVGVLTDDVNSTLYAGANLDSRTGNITSGVNRTFVIGHRDAPVASDSNRYTRALQNNSRHHYTITCGANTYSEDFWTKDPPLGNTHNDGLPIDRANPGAYAYPTVTGAGNKAQRLIEPFTGYRAQQTGSAFIDTGVTGLCGTATVTAGGVPGYNCFSGQELFWVSADGTDARDLGKVETTNGAHWGFYTCGGSTYQPFDPLDGDQWFCIQTTDGIHNTLLKVQYGGSHAAGTPGVDIPDCALDGGVQPCLTFTIMQTPAQSVSAAGSAFSNVAKCPGTAGSTGTAEVCTQASVTSCNTGGNEYAWTPFVGTSGGATTLTVGACTQPFLDYAGNPPTAGEFPAGASVLVWSDGTNWNEDSWEFGGISSDGDALFWTREGAQDRKGWLTVFTLGDRTPAGTDANSVRVIAASSSYQVAPCTWCGIHSNFAPSVGIVTYSSNDLSILGPPGTYTSTLTSAALNVTLGVPGGLNTCPANTLGVTGQVCTSITVNGEPIRATDSANLQPVQVGDLAQIDSEYLRWVVKTSATAGWVQRGYMSTAAVHAGTTLTMACGTRNSLQAAVALWNYRADPHGVNASGNTLYIDPGWVIGHQSFNAQVQIFAGWNAAVPACPGGWGGYCYKIRQGDLATFPSATPYIGPLNPNFANIEGVGRPNDVDTHPQTCYGALWCLDGRPLDGGTDGMVGSLATPFTNVAGQLWKFAGAGSILHRKQLETIAYVGPHPYVDISGPATGNVIPTDATGDYEYCLALAANECRAGAAAGDLYVNAPAVDNAYCLYPGTAVQPTANSICFGDFGANTASLVQVGVVTQDLMGAYSRRIGGTFPIWNGQDVFWSATSAPNGLLGFGQIRCVNGNCAAPQNVSITLPPYTLLDTINRGSFQTFMVNVPPVAGASTALVEFGYDPGFFCTSRQEKCAAVGTVVSETTPFYWESEAPARPACAAGCAIAVPALPGRVIYWQYVPYTAGGVAMTPGPMGVLPN
jgi:hypothetical protein